MSHRYNLLKLMKIHGVHINDVAQFMKIPEDDLKVLVRRTKHLNTRTVMRIVDYVRGTVLPDERRVSSTDNIKIGATWKFRHIRLDGSICEVFVLKVDNGKHRVFETDKERKQAIMLRGIETFSGTSMYQKLGQSSKHTMTLKD